MALSAVRSRDRSAVLESSPSARPLVPIGDLAAYLLGRWSVERRIDHASGGPRARFFGVATCSRRGIGILAYSEHGRLDIGRRCLEARRDLEYRLVTRASAAVHFTDGEFFHVLDLSRGHHRVRHLCGDDTYSGSFLAVSCETLLVQWNVIGPTKSYASTTLFRRLNDPPIGRL